MSRSAPDWEEVVHHLDVLAQIRSACGLGPAATRALDALVTFRETSLDPHIDDPERPFEYDRETAERMTRVTLEYAGLIGDALDDATRARGDVARHDSRGTLCERLQEVRSQEWRERAEELHSEGALEFRVQLDAGEYDEEVLDSLTADEVEASELATAVYEDPPAALERLRTRPRLRRLGDFEERERELRELVEACAAP
jgi:hypothetical protein